ncbi:MAG: 50S ribosomal protein L30 [bacterium]|nr:50S ribosomal protein L30 [bacterium]
MKKLKVTQIKSIIGSTYRKKRTMRALGLKRIRHSVIHRDTPQIRGMIEQVKELVKVENL